MDNPSAPSGKAMKYARREHERRFLLSQLPEREAAAVVDITDRYFLGTRLRLRRMNHVEPAGHGQIFKLTQKVPAYEGGPGLVTNTYLSEPEFELFATLAGAVVTKTRYSIPPLGVDVFHGELAGLVMAEAEFDDEEECQAFEVPSHAVAEVTHDVRFTGGQLAVTDDVVVRDLLRSFGI